MIQSMISNVVFLFLWILNTTYSIIVKKSKIVFWNCLLVNKDIHYELEPKKALALSRTKNMNI